MPHLLGRKAICALAFFSLSSVILPNAAVFAADEPCTSIPANEEQFALGKQLFTETAAPPCAICHSLADADAEGDIGPNFDDLQPTEDMVRTAVTGGVGIMPAFEDSLTSDEIDAIALYVSTASCPAK